MTQHSVALTQRLATAVELRDIHLAACRYRRQGLVCSTCSDLIARVELLIVTHGTTRSAEVA